MNILCIMSQLRIYSPIEQVKKSTIGETIFQPDKNFLIPQLREDRGSKYKYEYKYKYRNSCITNTC